MTAAAIDVSTAWRDALAVWGANVNLSPPEPHERPKGGWVAEDPLAYIDLETRQVRVNFKLLNELQVQHCLTGILAHELGHHVRFPHTLRMAADLRLMEQRLLPGLSQSLTNLFYDLQVNEFVGHTHREQLCDVYRAFRRRDGKAGERGDPLFNFYLAIYEELWGLEPGDLVGLDPLPLMEKEFPGWRADARMFAQTFYDLPTDYLQFAYFCSRFARYIQLDPNAIKGIPLAGDVQQPGADDFAEAVWGNVLSDEAIDEAIERGWIDQGSEQSGDGDGALRNLNRALAGMPGSAQAAFRDTLTSRIYKRLAERHLIAYPRLEDVTAPEPFLPTTVEEWEFGDDPRAIDWQQTILRQGHLAGAMPLRRELEADAPTVRGHGAPPLEIYLDTSGSMPAPHMGVNAMTLAAQVLLMAAIRAGSKVRGVVYSYGPILASDWMHDEENARRWLLKYAGGGTDYPFDELVRSAAENAGVLRVIISDSDFLYNVSNGRKHAMEDLAAGIAQSRLLVAMLRLDEASARAALKPVLNLPNFRLVCVTNPGDLGRAAAALANALFEE
ncbi:MAG: hypothetical protein ICCCNLDF_03661 [Planctomycetes bacterium]|nr:hypothetical protein [Planctomycetota bacterium]